MADMNTDNRNDHYQILQELKSMREDLRDFMKITRDENIIYQQEMKRDLKEIKDKLEKNITEVAVMKASTSDIKALIWKVGGVAILVAATALAKGLGWY